jgi:hypothetical protein
VASVKVKFERRDLFALWGLSLALLVVGCFLIGSWRVAVGVVLVAWASSLGDYVKRTAEERKATAKLAADCGLCPVCLEDDCDCCPIPECHTPGCTSSHK